MEQASDFVCWLRENEGLKEKSARDVLSRLKRASKIVDLSQRIPDEDLLFEISKTPEFKKMSMSVRSQIKRAIKLYRKYHSI